MSKLIFVCLILFLASCEANPVKQNSSCADEQFTIANIKKIDEEKILTENDVITLVKPLSDNYSIDEYPCQGYTDQAKSAAYKIFWKRADEITPILERIVCRSQSPSFSDTDFAAISSESAILMDTRTALDKLNRIAKPCAR